MARPGRGWNRCALRVLAGAILAFGAVGSAGAQAPAAKKPEHEVVLRGELGWGGRFESAQGLALRGVARAGRWFPIWIEIENKREKEPFEGRISVQLADVEGTPDRLALIEARDILVPPQSTAYVRLLQRVWSADASAQLSFVVEARDRLTGRIPKGAGPVRIRAPDTIRDGLLTVVVGEQVVVQRLANQLYPLSNVTGQRQVNQVPRCLPEHLPERFAALDSVDVLVWPRCEGDVASDRVIAALYHWVRAGGTLVVGVGAAPPGPRIAGILPATVGEAVSVPSLGSLPADAADVRRDTPEVLYRLTPAEDAHVLREFTERVRGEDLCWVVRRHVGAGQVILVGADLTAQPFSEGAQGFWQRLAGWPSGGVRDDGTPLKTGGAPGPAPGLPPRQEWGDAPLHAALARGLADVKPATEVPFGWLALFLGAYVALIGPIDYWILRRLNRLEWTFFTFTVVTVLVTGGAWMVSQYLKGGQMLLRALEIRTSRADVKGSRTETVFGIYSNVHADLAVRHESPTAATAMFWVPDAERPSAAGRPVALALDRDGLRTAAAPVRIWTTEWFHAVASDDRLPMVTGRLTVQGEGAAARLQGRLTLADRRPWRDVHLVYGDRAWAIGAWSPGREIAIAPGEAQPLDRATRGWEAVPEQGYGSAPTPFPLEAAARDLLAASVGRRVGVAREFEGYDPWTRALALRPPPDAALLVGLADGGHESLRVPGHDPVPESIRIERVLIPVWRSP